MNVVIENFYWSYQMIYLHLNCLNFILNSVHFWLHAAQFHLLLWILHFLLQALLIKFLIFGRDQLLVFIEAYHLLINEVQESISFLFEIIYLVDAENFLNSNIGAFLCSVFNKIPELSYIAVWNVHVNVPDVHFILVFSVHVS